MENEWRDCDESECIGIDWILEFQDEYRCIWFSRDRQWRRIMHKVDNQLNPKISFEYAQLRTFHG